MTSTYLEKISIDCLEYQPSYSVTECNGGSWYLGTKT